MTNGDVLSIVLGGLAMVLAAAVAISMSVSPHYRGRFGNRAASTTRPVIVRLVPSAGTGLGYWWRFQTTDDAPPTSVDIFSFRSHDADETLPWQHELFEAPLTLQPARPEHVRGPALATAQTTYDISVGWTIHRSDHVSRGSAIATVKPEPYG